MANDHAKNAGPVTQEHPYSPAISPYAQPLGSAYPPGYPIYYAQPPDSSHGENASGVPPGPQYMIPFPAAPGVMYPYPPPPPGQGFPQYPQATPASANGQRPKRKQVKMACTNCANACKRCDETRPCERCIKYGIQDSCVDGVRKERQKGIKRGPYKRKSKTANTSTETSFVVSPTANSESEWQTTNGAPSTPASGQPPPPIQAIPHYPPPPEGFYPYFYPPPPGFIPPGHEGPSAEGGTNGANHPPPMVSYYPIPPPGFFAHYPPGAFPPPPNGSPATTMDPAEASRNTGQSTEAQGHTNGTAVTGKKRSRASRGGEAKGKKHRAAAATQESPTSGGTVGGSDHASEPGVNSPPDRDD